MSKSPRYEIGKIVSSALRESSAFRLGSIVVANQDGTYNVLISGSTEAVMDVTSDSSNSWQENDQVTLFFVQGDKRKAQIIGKAGYKTNGTITTYNI